MNTNYSLYNPGGSLNFDIPISVIQANEEDEAAEDARLKERELQDILTNAFDDITDDEYEGSLLNSPTQNSLHSEHSLVNDDGPPDARRRISPPFISHSEVHYDHAPKNGPVLMDTNEEFHQMEPETCNGETSEELHSSEQKSNNGLPGTDWEGQYYVDHWEENSDDQLHLRQVGNDINEERNSTHDNKNSKDNIANQQCFAYQPYNGEVNRINMIAFRPHALPVKDDALQAEFLNPGGDTNDQIKLQQIQILYNARGREIQKLQQQLDYIKDQMSLEVENHTRNLDAYREENLKNLENLQQCQAELESSKLLISKLEGQLRASDVQLVALTSKKNEVVQKLQIAESTIESLQVQIEELQKSENLSRMKERHSEMLTSIKEKHNEEVYSFKVEIDELKESLSLKEKEVEKLKDNLRIVTKECEEVKMDKAEAVNRLIKALEESQQECQRLVKQDKTTLNTLLNAPLSSININDDLVQRLKQELASTKEELELYTSVARLGLINDPNSPSIKEKLQNSPNAPAVLQDNLLSSLKSEVERCLACLQSKNEQLRKMHSELQSACGKLRLLQQELDSFKIEKTKAELKIAALTEELQAAKENLKRCDVSEENVELQRKVEGITYEYNKSIEKIEQLTSLNKKCCQDIRKLKEEMVKLVQTHDEDKRKAVDDCRESCLKLHNDASEASRARMEDKLMEMQIKNQKQVEELANELDGVKTLYVQVCEERRDLENKLQEDWNKIKAKEIEDVKLNLARSYEEKLQRMKSTIESRFVLDTQHNDKAIAEKVKSEVVRQVEEQLQQAKRLWEKEHELNVEEKVAAKAKEFFELHLLEKLHESSDGAIDDYLEQIQELENRVKETQQLYKQNLVDLEKVMLERKDQELKNLEERLTQERDIKIKEIELRKNRELQSSINEMEIKFQKEKKALTRELKEAKASKSLYGLKKQIENVDEVVKQQLNNMLAEAEEQHRKSVIDIKAKAEEEKRRAIMESELKNEMLLQEKLQVLNQKKDKEKTEALSQLERKLCNELEPFLESQKQRFVAALKQMQDSHTNEKAEMQQNYESKLSQLQEECKTLMQSQNQQHNYQNNLDNENEGLKHSLKVLEDKYRQTEKDMLEIVTDLKSKLVQKNIELNEKEKLLEQHLHSNERNVNITSSVNSELEVLKAKVRKAEEDTDNYKSKVEEAEQKYNDLVLKHKTLKEKVKKYHRFIHNKEKDFADNLLKLNDEHKAALENVAAIKHGVTDVLERKLGDLKSSFFQMISYRTLPESGPLLETKSNFLVESIKSKDSAQEQKMLGTCSKAEDLQNKFVETTRKIHDDIMLYLEECSRSATKKIEEEMAKASWLLSEHLEIMPKDVKRPETTHLRAPIVSPVPVTLCGSNSQTPTPELTSGRGTMVGNSASTIGKSDNAHNVETQTSAKDFSQSDLIYISKPLKYWSSTPFTQEHLNGYTIPIMRPTPGMSTDIGTQDSGIPSHERKDLKLTYDLAPEKLRPASDFSLPNPSTVFTNLTWKSLHCDDPIPEKLRPSPAKMASVHAEPHPESVVTTPMFDSEERKSRFIAFTNSLSCLKDEFWKDINGIKMKRPESILPENILN